MCCKSSSNKGRTFVCFLPRDTAGDCAAAPGQLPPAGGGAGAPGQSPPVLSGRREPLPTMAVSKRKRKRQRGREGRDGKQETDDPERAARAVLASAKTLERERVNRGELLRHSEAPPRAGRKRRRPAPRRWERGYALGPARGSSDPRYPPGSPFHIPRRSHRGGAGRGEKRS